MREVAGRWAWPLCALLLATGLPSAGAVPARTSKVDPLVADSLAALDHLTSACQRRDAADDNPGNGMQLPYRFCDDGLPPPGGGDGAIPVPVAYHPNDNGNDYKGLPAPATQAEVEEADATYDLQPESGNRIGLDIDVSLPATGAGSHKKRPVIVLMHGCCSGNKTSWEDPTVDAGDVDFGEKWHDNNSWYASRGYVVITYTARGFRNATEQGSTGTTQLDSRRFEINDYQYLVGLLVDHDRDRKAAGKKPVFNVNPKKIGVVGGSYGGGFGWMALTDPRWKSPEHHVKTRLAAVAPKYGWTDVVESLVPSGHYLDRQPDGTASAVTPSRVEAAPSRSPVGVEKQSFVAGLYATGNAVATDHTTFPQYVHEAYARLQQGEPYDGDATVTTLVDRLLENNSAYYQHRFFKKVRAGWRVPVYAAATWTDQLFPTIESVRFYNKLRHIAHHYPIAMYLGDYEHQPSQNKPTEWDDLCGDDHHICTLDDYRTRHGKPRLGKAPTRVRSGVNARIDRFLDHYLKGKGKRPKMHVAATTTVCAANATGDVPVDEPGLEYRAKSWRKLSPEIRKVKLTGGGLTTSPGADPHALPSDPIFRGEQPDRCFTTPDTPLPPGVVRLTSKPLGSKLTMMGIPRLHLSYDATGSNYWLAVRMFDVAPGGDMTMVSRQGCRVDTQAAPGLDCSTIDLSGNGWTFPKGHSVAVEVSQSDSPYLRLDNLPSTATIRSASIELPEAPETLRHDFRDR